MITKRITIVGVFVLCSLLAGGRSQTAPAPLTNIAGPAYGTRVVADTQFSEKHSAANAVDGRLEPGEGCWYSQDWTQLPCALTFTLDGEEEIRQVVLHQARWNGNMYHTKEFALETSADGKTWTRVATGELADDNEAKAVLDVNLRTRWLRVVVLSSYNPFQTCGLTEVEILAAGHLGFGASQVRLNGRPTPATAPVCGLSFVAADSGPQVAVYDRPAGLLACVRPGENATLEIPVHSVAEPLTLCADVVLKSGRTAVVQVSAGEERLRRTLTGPGKVALSAPLGRPADGTAITLETQADTDEAAVEWRNVRLVVGQRTRRLPLAVQAPDYGRGAPPTTPELRAPLRRALLEWDWKMQDGIGTERNPSSYQDALAQVLERGQRLIDDLRAHGHTARLGDRPARWAALKQEYADLAASNSEDADAWEALYLRVHSLRREIALRNPLFPKVPILFVKQVPGAFSHQLTQVYGRYARPGGGLFVLDKPGASMVARPLAPGALPLGSYAYPEISFEGDRLLFAYCQTDSTPQDTIQGQPGRYYHLYEMKVDGTGLTRLTDGPYDDFSPRYLPDGRILCISTRRGGWHRCGSPGCENYTLAVMARDGSMPRPISYHETQEWDPAVLHDGRIIYTRWDYVDRHPVFYEHLWFTFPDGTRPSVFFGNNTFNPVGIWEPKPVPNSHRVMATAAAHHAMTAGSIVLVDVGNGVDGLQCLIRLTPDAPFPESETPVGGWFNPKPDVKPFETAESRRWPGHCYRTPHPFSDNYFLAAYSFQGLIGEPHGNPANMFGIYWMDAFGNKELLYRDPNIASLWPVPIQARRRPPVIPSQLDPSLGNEGTFVVQNVYASDPAIPRGTVKALRVVQVLPKSTPGIDNPPVGRPRGAPGKQVLGTVPVEPDGSAHFRVPAGIEVAFQALDERGMAVQVMRSGTYLQPGERATCVGCHEPRTSVPQRTRLMATARPPSVIEPGPDGSKPFSYPILVQPVLDKHCVSCHSGEEPAGGVELTGRPEGRYTASYNALSARVPFSDLDNGDAVSRPGRFGAYGSPVMKQLLEGHNNVKLSDAELRRLATWMDIALFYGTFDPEDQARQQRGERIAGPALQ
ncbi:MAG: hypothetical protein GX774_03020 [Armatimonadetes bacterium]|nr:hypothetical protein [Armatimonadota bacterium]